MCEYSDTLVVGCATVEYTPRWEIDSPSTASMVPIRKIMSTIHSIVFSRLNAHKHRQVEIYFWTSSPYLVENRKRKQFSEK